MSQRNGEVDEDLVLKKVKDWKAKRVGTFSESEISDAIRNLNLLGWIDVAPSDKFPVPDDGLLYA